MRLQGIKYWGRHPLVRSVLTLLTGAGLGQLVTLLAMLVLSRYYTSSQYGVLGSFLSVATIIGSVATLQYSSAVMLPRRDSEAANVFLLGGVSVAVVTLGTALLLVLFPGPAGSLTNLKEHGSLLLLLPPFIFFNGLNQMLVGWGIRRKQFRDNATSQIARSLTMNGYQIIAGWYRSGAGALTAGATVGEVASSVNLIGRFWHKDRRLFYRCSSRRWMKRLVKEYYDFPLYSAPQTLINAASQGLPVLILGHFYGVAVAGLYAFAIRLIQAPAGLLMTPLRQVLLQKFCETKNRGEKLLPAYRKSTLALLGAVAVPTVVLTGLLPLLFTLVFGSAWHKAGEFACWLFVWQGAMFCNIPSILAARVIRMQKHLLFFDICTIVARAGVLVICGNYCSAEATVAAFSIVGVVLNLILILWIWQRLHHDEASNYLPAGDLETA